MTSASNITPTVSFRTDPTPRRSLTRKLTSLFGSKTSHLPEYHIELEQPLKQYGPGDSVKGSVVLNVAKPLGVTHVTVRLEGSVSVFKSNSRPKPNTKPNGGTRIATGRGKRWVSEYYGDGYASLFKEELVLCGEGRLDPNLYHFRFVLDFPPDLDLPSSIDFERGSICYTITSTITRPQSIAPTITCDTAVVYRSDVDVGLLPTPRLKTITLEPLDRGKSKPSTKRLTSSNEEKRRQSSQMSGDSRPARSSRTMKSVSSESGRVPSRRVSPSAASSISRVSPSVAASERLSTAHSSPRVSIQFDAEPPAPKNITVTVKLERAGCLPGDVVPLQISINHTKVVRSLHGIIITLYRQARVDMHPNLPLASEEGRSNGKFEDYYPRSRTGLGGLSLTSAGSSQNWRKDLSQTFAPIYIDPVSLSTSFQVGVRVPDDAFPSIRNTPGEMITFKYFVEVIIDIHGKLGQQERLPSLNMTGPASHNVNSQGVTDTGEDQYAVTAWGTNCVDTSVVRRDRNAVTSLCELIIGNRNSDKSRSKQPQLSSANVFQAEDHSTALGATERHRMDPLGGNINHSQPNQNEEFGESEAYAEEYPQDCSRDYPQDYQGYGYNGYDPAYGDYGYDYGDYGYDDDYYQDPDYYQESWPEGDLIEPPAPAEEGEISEKERLRRAEALLLPSQPPEDDEDEAAGPTPTAPYIPSEADFISAGAFQAAVNGHRPAHPNSNGRAGRAAEAGASTHVWTVRHDHDISQSAPNGNGNGDGDIHNRAPFAAGSSVHPEEDKQELERQRLAAQVSAPDYSDDQTAESSETAGPAPSAPSLPSEAEMPWAGHEGGESTPGDASAQVGESLPRYVR